MATHDYNIANQGFPAFRADLNDALAAIVSNNSSATEPATTFAYQWWMDTAADPSVLKVRNADNDAWITLGTFNQTADTFTLTSAVSATTLNTSGQVVFNDAGADVDFRVEGDTDANLLFVDASTDRVGIGKNNPGRTLDVNGTIGSVRSGSTSAILQVINDNNSWNIATGTSTAQFKIDNNLVGNAVTIDSSNNFQFNSGYGSVATAYGCRAWVNFNGTGTVAIREDGNVSSVTDLGTGYYRINFLTSMPDANFAVTWECDQVMPYVPNSNTTSYCEVQARNASNVDVDSVAGYVSIFR